MKIVLATGIYPPDIGGPATYTAALARVLVERDHEVIVIAYEPLHKRIRHHEDPWQIVDVSRKGTMRTRWRAFADALKTHADDVDIVYAFSSVSCGVPMRMANLSKPKKILRLGGDFFWERYTAKGGHKGLKEWYESWHWLKICTHWYMQSILLSLDHLVFSTEMQQRIYENHFGKLPSHTVIENAVPQGLPSLHQRHDPFKLLFMGRFVGFKNLPTLIRALEKFPKIELTLIGEGPLSLDLISLVSELDMNDRVTFVSPVHGGKKEQILREHDMLIIPSVTEISPNIALEARSAGLPILLTKITGLSSEFTSGMTVTALTTQRDIEVALADVLAKYDTIAEKSVQHYEGRTWSEVTDEHLALFSSLQ